MSEHLIVDDMELFLTAIPVPYRTALQKQPLDDLIEVIMDLGRIPYAIFDDREVALSDDEVGAAELRAVRDKLGRFGGDNRAGIERTLHRFSAIRNREGDVIGLTCRVGRSVEGAAEIVRDLIESGKSILMLGRPGIGKTTILRETARILSTELGKRVVVVDTSNEIGGDGDIPHPGIGRARRLQVPHPDKQHQVMIEAVENHMPEVIVIDEMGTVLETEAARTIAERGVQLIATAHGNTLENLMANPTLNDLVGGIQSVTLGDEEARRRGTQKTILERKAPPTFEILIELHKRWEMTVHKDVAYSVDQLLRRFPPATESRRRGADNRIVTELTMTDDRHRDAVPAPDFAPAVVRPTKVYYLGLTRKYIAVAAHQFGAAVEFVEDVEDADLILVLKKFYKKRPQPIRIAESEGVPVFIVRSNTLNQIESTLMSVTLGELSPEELALHEAEQAYQRLQQGEETVELSPQNDTLRRVQHHYLEGKNVRTRSKGYKNRRRVVAARDEA